MDDDESNFQKLWMMTAGNLSVEIRYQKLRVNFIYCFKHRIFQNQVYNSVLYPGSFCTAVVSEDLVFFLLAISCHSNVSEKFDFCVTGFRTTIGCLRATYTPQISANFS